MLVPLGWVVEGKKEIVGITGAPATKATLWESAETPPAIALTCAVPMEVPLTRLTWAMPLALVMALEGFTLPSVVEKVTVAPSMGPLPPETTARSRVEAVPSAVMLLLPVVSETAVTSELLILVGEVVVESLSFPQPPAINRITASKT
ncbi:hypothetical protein JCM30471_26100 [Desulfuromonas carbonis]|nr:hypothetical protein [Desulfuromonas sp. DDH964]